MILNKTVIMFIVISFLSFNTPHMGQAAPKPVLRADGIRITENLPQVRTTAEKRLPMTIKTKVLIGVLGIAAAGMLFTKTEDKTDDKGSYDTPHDPDGNLTVGW